MLLYHCGARQKEKAIWQYTEHTEYHTGNRCSADSSDKNVLGMCVLQDCMY